MIGLVVFTVVIQLVVCAIIVQLAICTGMVQLVVSTGTSRVVFCRGMVCQKDKSNSIPSFPNISLCKNWHVICLICGIL
jgi:hypothetical protein